MKKSPICVITGLGEGTGGHTAKRFAHAGYRIAMLARTKERLTIYERELKGSKGYECDVSKLDLLKETCESHPQILIHNAVKGNFEKLLEGKPEWLEENFRINTTSLMYLVHAFIPNMVESKKGVIIVTGNTAAKRGVANTPYFAPTKAAQRILAQSLAKDFGPKGIHVAYLTVDASIIFTQPEDIADEIFHIAHQKRSAWSFDVEIRPDIEHW